MTSRLTDLLTETAEAAHNYADGAAAVAAVRSRRRRRRLIAVPVAAAVAVLLVFLLVPGVRMKPDRLTPAAPAPSAPVEPEPFAGRAIGPATMVYTTCARNCEPRIVGADGRQYTLQMAYDGAHEYALSPDGRWFSWTISGGLMVQDLTDRRTRSYPDPTAAMNDPWSWSPDSRRLLVVRHTDGVAEGLVLMDLAGNTSVEARTARAPVAVLDDGTLLSWQGEPGRSPLTFADVRDGKLHTTATRAFDVAAHLRPGEEVMDEVKVSADNSQAMLTVLRPPVDANDVGTPTAVLILTLGAGRVDARIDLPGDADLWQPSKLSAASVRAVRWLEGDAQVVDIDRVTGTPTVVTTVPGGVTVQLAGDAR